MVRPSSARLWAGAGRGRASLRLGVGGAGGQHDGAATRNEQRQAGRARTPGAAGEEQAPGLQEQHGQDIGKQQRQRQGEQLRLDRLRGVALVDAFLGAGWHGGQRLQQALGCHQVERARAPGRAIVARRMLGAGPGVGDLGGGDGLRRRRRALEQAEAVEHLQRRQHVDGRRCVGGRALGVVGERVARPARAAETGDPPQHLHEQARQREVRPVRVGGDVEEDHLAVAAPCGRDQRRAVPETGPDLDVGPEPGRVGQHLLVDQHLGGAVSARQTDCRRRRVRAAAASPRRARRRASCRRGGAAREGDRRRHSRGGGRRSARGRRPSSPTPRPAP